MKKIAVLYRIIVSLLLLGSIPSAACGQNKGANSSKASYSSSGAATSQQIKDDARIESPAPQMRGAFAAFLDLQRFLCSRQRFLASQNEATISRLIGDLRANFHSISDASKKFSNEPGFQSTLRVITDMLDDAKNRFYEGKKGYALWRLKTASSYCISCHTRYEVPLSFADASDKLEGLTNFEQGEFFLATRQFERATTAFLNEVYQEDLEDTARLDALRHWLLVFTRVHPDADQALDELSKIMSRVKLRTYEREEVEGWASSLRRWSKESPAEIPPLVKAENLIRQALSAGDPLSGRKGTVELLRATAILHRLSESREGLTSGQRGHVLYLLGLAYSELPFFFISELPEMFFEQAIREVPNSKTAQEAFRRYREVVTLGYTGSGGTRLPDDVLEKFKELHAVAYGVPTLSGQI